MSVNVFTAAKTLGECCGWRLLPLKMQKLLYLANMNYLGKNNSPLIDTPFEAWSYGPIQPLLYHKLKRFSLCPARDVFFNETCLSPRENEKEYNALNNMAKLCYVKSGTLISFTHSNNGAWARMYEPGIEQITIPDEFIAQEYEFLIKKHANDKKQTNNHMSH